MPILPHPLYARDGAAMIPSGSGNPAFSTAGAGLPLLKLASVIIGTIGPQTVVETLMPHILPRYTTMSSTITTTTTLTTNSRPVTVTVGPSGACWAPHRKASIIPELKPPVIPPSSAAAASDDARLSTVRLHSGPTSARLYNTSLVR